LFPNIYLLINDYLLQLSTLLARHHDCKSHKGTAQIQHRPFPLASTDANITTYEVQVERMLFWMFSPS